MPYNREITAAIGFEPETANSKKEPIPSGTQVEPEPIDQKDSYVYQNEATRNIIRCLKWALARSITSISHPAKQRALNPKKDFTIQSRIDVTLKSSTLGMSCCGGGAGSVKHRKREMSIHRDDSVGCEDDSDTDPGGDDEDPPVSFTLIDYSPMCYRHIREFLGIDPSTYCDVLVRSQWHSVPTPGKSAAQLFFCGKDWVIKTMTQEESDFLRSILHRYYFHVLDNPYTLLPHFVGHHRLEVGGEKMNVIIMQNVFATGNTIHEKYDLKGSTVGRFATDAEKMKQTCTQKDLDLNHPINVGPIRRALLIEQIKKDCEFLKRSSIMDYSFLVGVHIPPAFDTRKVQSTAAGGKESFMSPQMTIALDATFVPGTGEPVLNRTISQFTGYSEAAVIDGRCFTADQGGMMSAEQSDLRREIYYIGIIDILQEYNVRKSLETLVFGAVKDREKISSVPPAEYASRFIAFMSCIIV